MRVNTIPVKCFRKPEFSTVLKETNITEYRVKLMDRVG